MSRSLQGLVFAAAAALLVGAVFLLQSERGGRPAVRAPALAASATRAESRLPGELADVERVAALRTALQIDAQAEAPTVAAPDTPAAEPAGGARVHLLVLGLDGRPVAGRSVRLVGPELDGPSVRFTDEAGELHVADLHPGAWAFYTWPEGDELARAGIEGSFERRFEFQREAREVLASGDVRSIVLGARGADEARVYGRLSRQGVGVAGHLTLRHIESGELRSSETDADGNFDVALEPTGRWRIEARRRAAVERRREPSEDESARGVSDALLTVVHPGAALVRELDLAPGADVRLELELPIGSIAGSVIGADGRPVWALVELWPGPVARTHVALPQARFDFQDVAPGAWTLHVGDPEFAALSHSSSGLRVDGQSFEVALAPGESLERTLQLAPASHRVGRVVDESGAGIEGALLWLWRAEAPGEPRLAGMSIEDGRFWTPSLVYGRIALVAFAPERVSAVLELEHTAQEARALAVDLRLGAGASLELEGVARGDLRSLRDAQGRDFAALARAGASGLVCGPLPPGDWRVALARSDGALAERQLTLAPGERRRLRP